MVISCQLSVLSSRLPVLNCQFSVGESQNSE
jgi:hypothetical protein